MATTQQSKRRDEELREAFRCIVSLAHAKPVDNKMTCSVYLPMPDESRSEEQAEAVWQTSTRVRIFLQSWVLPFLEEHLGLDEQVIKEIMERQHDERTASIANPHTYR